MDAQRKHASAAEASLVADDISATIVLLVMGEAGVSATSFPNNFFLGGGAWKLSISGLRKNYTLQKKEVV